MVPPKAAAATCYTCSSAIKLASQGYTCDVCFECFHTTCSTPTAVRIGDKTSKSCATCIIEANPEAACTPTGVRNRSGSTSSNASSKVASTGQAEIRTQRLVNKLEKVDFDKLDKLDRLENNIALILEKVCVLPEVVKRVEEHDARITRLEETSDTVAKRLDEIAASGVGAAEDPRVEELMKENVKRRGSIFVRKSRGSTAVPIDTPADFENFFKAL